MIKISNGDFKLVERFSKESHGPYTRAICVFDNERMRAGEWDFPHQKCAATHHLLGTGNSADHIDEYLKISDRTARECLYNFCDAIVVLYKDEYLYRPNTNDIRQLFEFHEDRHGLPGMLGSLDLVLEAVASQDLWFWHAFFGTLGVHNDIIVIRRSNLLVDTFTGRAYDSSFQVNGAHYKYGYYLTDEIYPEWAVLVKAFRELEDENRIFFKKAQEAGRKDVKRTFGRLKKKFEILKRLSRACHTHKLSKVMYACVILHNMTLEDAGRNICTYVPEEPTPEDQVVEPGGNVYFTRLLEVQNRQTHHDLRHDLTGHVWANRRD